MLACKDRTVFVLSVDVYYVASCLPADVLGYRTLGWIAGWINGSTQEKEGVISSHFDVNYFLKDRLVSRLGDRKL